MPDLQLLIFLVILLALIFDFINGFHDTANAIATSVSTRAIHPQHAIIMAAGLSEPLRSGLGGALVEDRSARFAADALVPGIDSDPQLAGRLGLWGRRVVGEEIGTLQRMLASFPPLLDGAAGLEDVHAVLSEGAVTRMRSLGLRD